MQTLRERNVWFVGTAAEATQDYTRARASGPLALVMGGEEKGMRRLTREHCDELVQIPMAGSVSSLNVSVATAVVLYDMRRQRQRGG